jgi:hypothetical protein
MMMYTRRNTWELYNVINELSEQRICWLIVYTFTVIVSYPNMSVHLSLRCLAVCDWSHMPTVFVTARIKFTCPGYF